MFVIDHFTEADETNGFDYLYVVVEDAVTREHAISVASEWLTFGEGSTIGRGRYSDGVIVDARPRLDDEYPYSWLAQFRLERSHEWPLYIRDEEVW